jgi:hypothetical protein
MALATLQIAAIPVLAGLVAGTGAVATYVASPPTSAPANVASVPDCAAQTWPYIDRACVAAAAAPQAAASAPQEERKVRLVTAPRPDEAFDARFAPAQPMSRPSAAAPTGLTTSDGVLRQPQNLDAIPNAPVTTPAKAKRSDVKREKRARSETRVAVQPYQVPAERSGETREVYVVRPLRLDLFR